ncbi:MAG: NADH-quinone oxidoreductase subunit C [Actinomycetota bacterium]|nr:NADH-quinone oxidoreductase subunit C [Actinomycetota bacterium]
MSDQPDTPPEPETDSIAEYAAAITERLGAEGYTVEFDTARVFVAKDKWVATINEARKELPLFSWLSAIDWSRETEVGEGVAEPDELEERFEVMCRLSSVTDARAINFFATLSKDDPTIGSLTATIGGAEWHEREAHEMFGIMFEGNENLIPLYLPDDFIGNPLLKSFPLIAREVKPWPGDVDVEGLPSSDDDDGGDV